MRTTTVVLVAGLLSACAVLAPAADGVLSDVRHEVRDPSPSSGGSSASTGHQESHHHDHDDLFDVDDELFGTVVFWGVCTPYWGPVVALDDDYSPGWGEPVTHQPQRAATQAVSTDLLAAWQRDRDGVVHRWFRGEVSTAYRVGVAVTLDRLDEHGEDHLLLGQADLSVRFAQGHGWAFTSGLGGRWLHDAGGTDGGIDLFYGVEVWPIAPLLLRGQLAGGRLGDAGVFDAWAHLGAGWRHGEVFIGERYLRIGAVALSGPLLGAGFHW